MEKELSKRSANKRMKKEMIINAAEMLFLDKGFEAASMDDVSKESGLSKRTIYQYFISKEDLFFAVALKGMQQFFSDFTEAAAVGRNSLEKIRLSNKAYYDFYAENPRMFRIINYIPDNRNNCEASPHYHQLGLMKDEAIRAFMNIVDEGKSDGSINPRLDTKKAAYFGMFSAVGLLNMIDAMNKSVFWQNEGIEEKAFLLFSMDLLADALGSSPPISLSALHDRSR